MARVRAEASRFYDGGPLNGEPPEPHDEPLILLKRVMVDKPPRFAVFGRRTRKSELFELQRRIAYRARWNADRDDLEIVVPARPVPGDSRVFLSDLTSVPTLFTWLVPRTGLHLPAALIHDGLIYDPGEPASYEATQAVPRIEADRIFRDGMADLGTGIVRRWLIWAAVTLATAKAGVSSVSPPGRTSGPEGVAQNRAKTDVLLDWYYRIVVVATLALIAFLGTLATIDLFDWRSPLPWMGDRSWVAELAWGLAFAVLIPAALSLLWWRLWRAGMIAGVALAVLFHVTIVLGALTLLFQFVEWVLRQWRRDPGAP